MRARAIGRILPAADTLARSVTTAGLVAAFMILPVMASSQSVPDGAARCSSGIRGHVDAYLSTVRIVRLREPPGDEVGVVSGVARSPHDLIAIADQSTPGVALFNPDGTFLRHLGRRGSAPGEFESTAGVAFLSDTVLAVADEARSRLTLLHISGRVLRQSTMFARPVGGMLMLGVRLHIGGFVDFRSSRAGVPALVLVTDELGETVAHQGRLPSRYAPHRSLLSGPVLIGASDRLSPRYFVTWRYGSELLRLSASGRVERTASLARLDGFIDPVEALSSGPPPEPLQLVRRLSPIIVMAAARTRVIVGYVPFFRGESEMRVAIFDEELHLLADGLRGGQRFFGASGDTLLALAERDTAGNLAREVRWLVPCTGAP